MITQSRGSIFFFLEHHVEISLSLSLRRHARVRKGAIDITSRDASQTERGDDFLQGTIITRRTPVDSELAVAYSAKKKTWGGGGGGREIGEA